MLSCRWIARVASVCLASLVVPAMAVCEAPQGPTRNEPSHAVADDVKLTEQGTLDRIQRAAFAYLWVERDLHAGLVYNTSEPNAPASPTACGVALSAIPIGIERGWISREQGYERASQLLRSLASAEGVKGFFYHFLNPGTGRRTWHSEVSCIDSSILFAGAMVIGQYFPGTEVEALANALIERAEWPWFLDEEDTLKWAWRPESGFEGGAMHFSESILAYLLAMGSPTHPISPSTWNVIKRPVASSGVGRSVCYTPDGSLFAYLLPLAWFDLRDHHDAYLDYWTNANTAILANKQFCESRQASFRTYREGLWGLSAALGPHGYKAYGASPADHLVPDDGTIAPYVVAASIPFTPDLALRTLSRMEELRPSLWTRYGLGNAVNLDLNYGCPFTIALDQGLALLMIENYRTGLIWQLFMHHPIAARAMEAAGFVPGSLDEPVSQTARPGNPGASVSVPALDHAVTVDADLSEWGSQEAIELTPDGHRNVESGFFQSPQDASAAISIGWTQEMVYVAGRITDDELVTRQKDERIYQDDCLELFWDLDGDGFRFDRNPHDVQFGLAPGGPDGQWQLWAWGPLNRRPQEVQAAMKREGEHFVFEIGIPRTLLPGLTVGSTVRFSAAYHDRDTDEKEGKLNWSVDTASVPGKLLFGWMTLELPATTAPAATSSTP